MAWNDFKLFLKRSDSQATHSNEKENKVLVKMKSDKMKKFNVFKYHKFILTELGMYPTQSQNTNNVRIKLLTIYCILFILISIFVSGVVFMYKNVSELTVVLRSCILIFATSQSIGMFYFYVINMSSIHVVHFKLQEITDKIVEGTMVTLYACNFFLILS